ncbi:MAG: hypothetical protein JSS29_02595 [Proteobacteria bacterium]|nr:hypothetical protein [Pseudomonadota bacterium]
MPELPASSVAVARQTLAQNRLELQGLSRAGTQGSVFPRSATFRWIAGHLNGRALAATAFSALIARPQLLQTAVSWLWARRRSRRP